ncbi:DoxX family protein [Rhodococcus sp. RS1C4]|uniref:DoxX family protein n=1 Tax=Nocardiaceae TaxID=85025 RepID=UPI00037AD3A6|nr:MULTISPECIES: DoxX family protein [Rhodococcus]OZC55382.1 DoxX family protein [Rhodococcus sp. 06-621-2]OZC58298.1 DoxX family protein [Rhodococcus sp. RS1C4]OZC88133.1 DoxX family protein [Rhodococcus sp. 06-418-1B]OZD11704.1 DoxX family protein [Rhodococcus sp. 06-156-4C]OZD15547.1 DoxX family protein [Rhodococcus sp. 06-156-4a]
MNSTIFRDIATLVARIGLGIVFIAHGWQKLNTNGLDATKAGFEGMGVPLPAASAYFATFVELIGGVALVVGIFTPIIGILLFLDMLGAFLFVHYDLGVFVSEGGYELVLALGVGALLIAATGAGRFSLDAATGGRTSFAKARA